MLNQLDVVKALAGQAVKFVTLTYTKPNTKQYAGKGAGEVARYTITVGNRVEDFYAEDIAILTELLPTLSGVDVVAAQELLASRQTSLAVGVGNNPDYTCAGVYEHLTTGIKFHKEKGALYITGLAMNKFVLQKGDYKVTDSSQKTLAKDELRTMLPSGKFRQFKLDNVAKMSVNGVTLDIAN